MADIFPAIFVVVDFETATPTGRPPEPIELAAMRFGTGALANIDTSFEEFIRLPSGVELTSFDTNQTGIIRSDIEEARLATDVLGALERLVEGDDIIVAQNAKYEAAIFSRLLPSTAKLNSLPFIDTILLAKRVLGHLDQFNLGSLATALGIKIPIVRHRAMIDVSLTRKVFIQLLAKAIRQGEIRSRKDLERVASVNARKRDQLTLF